MKCANATTEAIQSLSRNPTQNPSIDNYKLALKNLGGAIKSAHKTEEGKKLSAEYWLLI